VSDPRNDEEPDHAEVAALRAERDTWALLQTLNRFAHLKSESLSSLLYVSFAAYARLKTSQCRLHRKFWTQTRSRLLRHSSTTSSGPQKFCASSWSSRPGQKTPRQNLRHQRAALDIGTTRDIGLCTTSASLVLAHRRTMQTLCAS